MIPRQRLLILLALWLPVVPAAAEQSPRVVVQRLEDRQLKRIAHNHRVPVERVQKARELLMEATGQYQESEPDSAGHTSPQLLASLWVQLYPKEAPRSIGTLFRILVRKAESAQEDSTYVQLWESAKRLAAQIAYLDPQGTLELIDSWPKPPASLSENCLELFETINIGLEDAVFQDVFEVDPVRAILNLGNKTLQQSHLNGAAQRLAVLNGDAEKVDQIVDEVIEQVRSSPHRTLDLDEYFNFLQTLSNSRSERILDLLTLGLEALQSAPSSQGQAEMILETDLGDETFGQLEMKCINLAQNLYSRPQLALDVLQSVPGLTEKLERLGGVDQGLRARPIGYRSDNQVYYYQLELVSPEKANADRDFARLLDRNVTDRPAWVRNQLLRQAEADPTLARLYNIFNQSMHPEVKEISLEILSQTVLGQEDNLEKLAALQRLIQSYNYFDGSPPTALMQTAFTVLDRVRKDTDDSPTKTDAASAQTRQYESYFLAEWACIDFDSAFLRVSRVKDFPTRIQLLTQMTQRLLN